MPALDNAPYLKPCPFCGRELKSKWNRANPSAKCETPDCMGSKLPSLCLDVPEHIEAWNTRAESKKDVTSHPDLAKPLQTLSCCCCGGYFTGRQFHNQDTGFGLGPCCLDYVKPRVEDIERIYGVFGVHYMQKNTPAQCTSNDQSVATN